MNAVNVALTECISTNVALTECISTNVALTECISTNTIYKMHFRRQIDITVSQLQAH